MKRFNCLTRCLAPFWSVFVINATAAAVAAAVAVAVAVAAVAAAVAAAAAAADNNDVDWCKQRTVPRQALTTARNGDI